MKSIYWILLLPLLIGCTSNIFTSVELEHRWSPLKKIVEADLPFVSDTATTTIGTTVYVSDLNHWLQQHPLNSAEFDALMLHEKEHAIRQLKYGLTPWITRYLTDKNFAWEEEKIGWKIQIEHLKQMGRAKSPEFYAIILSTKYNNIISYIDALTWIRSWY